jgi:hypothetical protein
MKKIVSVIVVLAFCLTTTMAFAGGGQNLGSKGKGAVKRIQVSGKGR